MSMRMNLHLKITEMMIVQTKKGNSMMVTSDRSLMVWSIQLLEECRELRALAKLRVSQLKWCKEVSLTWWRLLLQNVIQPGAALWLGKVLIIVATKVIITKTYLRLWYKTRGINHLEEIGLRTSLWSNLLKLILSTLSLVCAQCSLQKCTAKLTTKAC
jgi:hypothetical protein